MIRTMKEKRPGSPHRRFASSRRVDVADHTEPLDLLKDQRVMALLDIENLHGGAADLGMRVSFAKLAELLKEAALTCRLHAVFSRKPGDRREELQLSKSGFIPHPRDIEVVTTQAGNPIRRLTNSDETILFLAGCYTTRGRIDAVLLGSGDGDLVCELARNIKALPTPRRVFTLSLAGSTSHRLNAENNPFIDGNIELGINAMHES